MQKQKKGFTLSICLSCLNCTSGKDVYILPQIPLTEGVGRLGP